MILIEGLGIVECVFPRPVGLTPVLACAGLGHPTRIAIVLALVPVVLVLPIFDAGVESCLEGQSVEDFPLKCSIAEEVELLLVLV